MEIFRELKQGFGVIGNALWDLYERLIAPGVTANILLGGIIILMALLLLGIGYLSIIPFTNLGVTLGQ